MKTTLVKATLLLSALLCVNCTRTAEMNTASGEIPAMSDKEMIARGKYLVTVSACHDCHSPKIMTPNGPELDTTRLLSGHPMNEKLAPVIQTNDWLMFNGALTAYVGPWGVTYSANLTPDDTGIGNWKYEQFERAIRKGKYKGLETSRPLLPPMPWQMYRNFNDEDLKAIFSYLKSLPPVNNLVPNPVPPGKVAQLK
jgi:hypothetical protein